MKKFATCLLVVALLLTCMATVAFAAVPGDTVTISFSTSGNPGFATYRAYINYDSEVLELTSIDAGALSAGMFTGNVENGAVGYINFSNVTGDGVLFTATFTIKEGAAAGEYPVTASLDTTSTANAAAEPVSFSISGGTVVVDAVECEHVWDDGVVTTPATCTTPAVTTYTCTLCGETKTEEGYELAPHTLTLVAGTPATCCADGTLDSWECSVCGGVFTDDQGRYPAIMGSLWQPATGEHDLEYVDNGDGTHDATCKVSGELIIDNEAHDYNEHDGLCACGAEKPTEGTTEKDPSLDDEPGTGDITPMITMGAFVLLSMAAAVVYLFKRKAVK